jgi:uncharacterized protein (TIGR02996 family)
VSAHYRQLLEAVRDAPDELGPRLILADWLHEQGDARGELIAAQCRLAQRGLDPATRGHLKKRVGELFKQHLDAWLAPARAVGARQPVRIARSGRVDRPEGWHFRQGFLYALTCPIEPLLSDWQALFDAEPIVRLALEDVTAESAEGLAQSGILARITQLTIRGSIGDAGAGALAESPDIGRIERLNLKSVGMTDGGLAHLLEAKDFRPKSLALTDNEITDQGATELARSPVAERLECLYLSRTKVADDGVAALAQSPHLGRLERLTLSALEELTEQGARALAESAYLTSLRCVEVDQCFEVGEQGIALLQQRFDRVRAY